MTSELETIALIENWSEAYDIADGYRDRQQWQAAAMAFKRSAQLNPAHFWSYHHLGDACTQLKQWRQAAIAYSQAVKLDDEFFWSWHNLGNACTQLKQWRQAAIAYSQAVKLDDEFFWSWHNLGNACTQLKAWDRAISCYLRGIILKPEHPLIFQKLAIAFKQRDNLTASIQHYRQLIASPQPNSVFTTLKADERQLLKIAEVLMSQHQTAAAIVVYYMLLEIQPQQIEILQQLSKLLASQSQLAQNQTLRQQQLANSSSQLLTRASAKTTSGNQTKHALENIAIQSNCLVLPNQIENLAKAVGWQARPQKRLEGALSQSFAYVCAWYILENKQKLIGFTRAVADGHFHATVLDIMVHPDFQGQGIGKRIVQSLLEQLDRAKIQDITLFASPHLVDFYRKLGFAAQPQDLQWMLFVDR